MSKEARERRWGTVYDMSASTGYHPLGTRWPFIPPKRTPLIEKGGKP